MCSMLCDTHGHTPRLPLSLSLAEMNLRVHDILSFTVKCIHECIYEHEHEHDENDCRAVSEFIRYYYYCECTPTPQHFTLHTHGSGDTVTFRKMYLTTYMEKAGNPNFSGYIDVYASPAPSLWDGSWISKTIQWDRLIRDRIWTFHIPSSSLLQSSLESSSVSHHVKGNFSRESSSVSTINAISALSVPSDYVYSCVERQQRSGTVSFIYIHRYECRWEHYVSVLAGYTRVATIL